MGRGSYRSGDSLVQEELLKYWSSPINNRVVLIRGSHYKDSFKSHKLVLCHKILLSFNVSLRWTSLICKVILRPY